MALPPSAPAFIRNIQTTDSFFIHAITALNGRLYTSGWNGNTDIFDIRNILTSAPTLLGTVVSGDRSHSSWVSSDARLLVSATVMALSAAALLYPAYRGFRRRRIALAAADAAP
jgi:hypothetical protein